MSNGIIVKTNIKLQSFHNRDQYDYGTAWDVLPPAAISMIIAGRLNVPCHDTSYPAPLRGMAGRKVRNLKARTAT